MASVELIETPWSDHPYRMVFKRDGRVIGEIPVASPEAAKAIAADLLSKLEASHRT